jgi:hypothetical protein
LRLLSERFIDVKNQVGLLVMNSLNFQEGLKKLSSSIQSFTGYLQNLDTPTKTFAARVGAAAVGVATLATALKILHVQAMAKGIIAIATYNGVMGIKLALILKTTLAEYASIAAISAATGASKLRVASIIAETLALRGLAMALKVVGGGIAVVGVAWAGWEFGKWLGEIAGIEKLSLKIAGLGGEYEKLQKGIDENQKKELIKLAKLKDERIKNGTLKAPAAPDLSAQIQTTKDPEILKLQKDLEEKIAESKFNQLSDDGKINSLIEKRSELAVKYRDAISETESIKIGEEILKASTQLNDLQKQQQDKITSARESFQKKVEAFNYKNMTDEEKINFLLQKRGKLQNDVLLASKDKAYELKGEIVGIDEQLQDIQSGTGNKFSSALGKENNFAGAVEKGTVDAYRAELAGKSTTEEYTKKTADNTGKMYREALKQTQSLKKFELLGAV